MSKTTRSNVSWVAVRTDVMSRLVPLKSQFSLRPVSGVPSGASGSVSEGCVVRLVLVLLVSSVAVVALPGSLVSPVALGSALSLVAGEEGSADAVTVLVSGAEPASVSLVHAAKDNAPIETTATNPRFTKRLVWGILRDLIFQR